MAMYKDIQEYVKANCGYIPKTCWIAHTKEICGLAPRVAYNRNDINKRAFPCPVAKQADIIKALKHFGLI